MKLQDFFALKLTIFVFSFVLFFSNASYSQQEVFISGSVINEETQEPLTGVNVIVKGTYQGVSTDSEGKFVLKGEFVLPIYLQFSMIGFNSFDYKITQAKNEGMIINLVEGAIMGEEVIITAPLVEEGIFKAPISIERMDIIELRETPSASFYDALANIKGVDVATQGLQFKSINARGFNSTGNVRFIQLVDGMDNQAPGLNFPVGNIAGISELDIESLELMPGPSSALYGPNALNGVLLMFSKDPFQYQGLSIQGKTMANHVGFGSTSLLEFGLDPIIDFAVRYAKVFSDKLAFKVNTSFMKGEDWHAENFSNIHEVIDPVWGIDPETNEPYDLYLPANTDPSFEDPGYNGLNIYGDEIYGSLPLGLKSANIDVARTGYKEEDLVDYDTWNFKLNGALHYRLTSNITAILQGNYGIGTTVYTGDNRISLDNFGIFQGKAELKGNNFFIRGYSTQQYSGDSYDSRYLAINLNRNWKSDDLWFNDFITGYRISRYLDIGTEGGYLYARRYADSVGVNGVRPKPGTQEFETEKNRILNISDISQGAQIKNNSSLYHLEGKYDINDVGGLFNIQVGGNYRIYDLNSGGTLFADTAGNDITMYDYGVYSQIENKLFRDHLKLVGSIRYDKNENFSGILSPRFSAVYTPSNSHSIRISYQTGSRNPNTREQFIFQDLGYAILTGGYPGLTEQFDFENNSIFQSNVEDYKDAIKIDTDEDNPDRIGQRQAEIKNLYMIENGIVRKNDVKQMAPEQVRSFELEYKVNIANMVYADITYFNSIYQNFIGLKRLIFPRTSPSINILAAAEQATNSTQHDLVYLYSNSHEEITVEGLTLGLKFIYVGGSIFDINAAWTKLRSDIDDPVIPGFNTPEYKFNVSYLNREFYKNVGFNIVWRWQNAFFWQSPFGDGTIDRINTFDGQISFKIENPKSIIKFGVNNFLNIQYVNNFGGPKMGTLFYISFTMDNGFINTTNY